MMEMHRVVIEGTSDVTSDTAHHLHLHKKYFFCDYVNLMLEYRPEKGALCHSHFRI